MPRLTGYTMDGRRKPVYVDTPEEMAAKDALQREKNKLNADREANGDPARAEELGMTPPDMMARAQRGPSAMISMPSGITFRATPKAIQERTPMYQAGAAAVGADFNRAANPTSPEEAFDRTMGRNIYDPSRSLKPYFGLNPEQTATRIAAARLAMQPGQGGLNDGNPGAGTRIEDMTINAGDTAQSNRVGFGDYAKPLREEVAPSNAPKPHQGVGYVPTMARDFPAGTSTMGGPNGALWTNHNGVEPQDPNPQVVPGRTVRGPHGAQMTQEHAATYDQTHQQLGTYAAQAQVQQIQHKVDAMANPQQYMGELTARVQAYNSLKQQREAAVAAAGTNGATPEMSPEELDAGAKAQAAQQELDAINAQGVDAYKANLGQQAAAIQAEMARKRSALPADQRKLLDSVDSGTYEQAYGVGTAPVAAAPQQTMGGAAAAGGQQFPAGQPAGNGGNGKRGPTLEEEREVEALIKDSKNPTEAVAQLEKRWPDVDFKKSSYYARWAAMAESHKRTLAREDAKDKAAEKKEQSKVLGESAHTFINGSVEYVPNSVSPLLPPQKKVTYAMPRPGQYKDMETGDVAQASKETMAADPKRYVQYTEQMVADELKARYDAYLKMAKARGFDEKVAKGMWKATIESDLTRKLRDVWYKYHKDLAEEAPLMAGVDAPGTIGDESLSTKDPGHPSLVMPTFEQASQTAPAAPQAPESPAPAPVTPAPVPAAPVPQPKPKKRLSDMEAREYVRRAKGDKNKARALAKADGWEF